LSFEKPQVLITGQRRKGRRPRLIASRANSLPANSCLEDTSSVASSPASVSRKRPCADRDSSSRPFKKAYHTRSSERVVSKGDNPANDPDRSSCQPSSGATHVPAAAHTNTGLRDVLQKNPVGQGDATARNTRVIPVPTLEVVIVNKRPSSNCAAASKNHMQPVKRRTRHSSITPRMSPRLPRRRQSVPARVTRRSLETVIPCSEDDSDDELSFL
jgi:hypothetical protein